MVPVTLGAVHVTTATCAPTLFTVTDTGALGWNTAKEAHRQQLNCMHSVFVLFTVSAGSLSHRKITENNNNNNNRNLYSAFSNSKRFTITLKCGTQEKNKKKQQQHSERKINEIII